MYFCYHCKEPICFSDEYISTSGKAIPLNYRTKRPHNCIRAVPTHAPTQTPPKPKRIVAYRPFTNDKIPTQKIKHFRGTQEEFQEQWK
jgi:hypothetical protein